MVYFPIYSQLKDNKFFKSRTGVSPVIIIHKKCHSCGSRNPFILSLSLEGRGQGEGVKIKRIDKFSKNMSKNLQDWE